MNTADVKTENGMPAFSTTGSKCLDLFATIGSSRNKDLAPLYQEALQENIDLAVRILLWGRDVRGGAGERQTFRNLLGALESYDIEGQLVAKVLAKVPELGRWDDLLFMTTEHGKTIAVEMIRAALSSGNALCAKWMPRDAASCKELREKARWLREALGWSPKFYRKTLVNLTKVVETQMCEGKWDEINFNHVPSVASSRYRKAFTRHTPKYREWVDSLSKPGAGAKVNASAIFPHDVIRQCIPDAMGWKDIGAKALDEVSLGAMIAQWDALPNFIGEANAIPVCDVSGSMNRCIDPNSKLRAIDVAVSLSLYLADKNTGKFNGVVSTFSTVPRLMHLQGNIWEKINSLITAEWGMTTNLAAVFDLILKVAIENNLNPMEVPEKLIVISDMQFNASTDYNHANAVEMATLKFEQAGFRRPRLVFWNVAGGKALPDNRYGKGITLLSGYSPNVLRSVLNMGAMDTPMESMLATVMDDRYNWQ